MKRISVSPMVMCCLVMATLDSTGCNRYEGRVPVTGQVMFDGKPLESGFISFVGPQEYSVASGPIVNGQYRVSESPSRPGISPGKYGVQIESWIEQPGATLPSGGFSPGKSAIPDKYRKFKESGLAAEVDSAHHNFDFELKSN